MRTVFFSIVILFVTGTALAQNSAKNIYSKHAWAERDRWQKPHRLIRLLKISEGDRVADIGCHEGYMTVKLARTVGKEGVVFAVDVSQGKLAKLRAHAEELGLTQINIVNGAEDNPKLPQDTLDAVLILDAYHEMDRHEEILQHIKTSLKKGGRLLLCEPIKASRRTLSREEQEKKHELSMNYAIDDLKRAGFRIALQLDNYIDRRKEKGDSMWVVVAVKD